MNSDMLSSDIISLSVFSVSSVAYGIRLFGFLLFLHIGKELFSIYGKVVFASDLSDF